MLDNHPDSEFVALSQFTVQPGMEDEVCKAFMHRPHLVDDLPGFIKMQVLRPTTKPNDFWLLTWWEDQESYESWHHSQDYHDSHQHIPKGLKLVPGSASITLLKSLPQ